MSTNSPREWTFTGNSPSYILLRAMCLRQSKNKTWHTAETSQVYLSTLHDFKPILHMTLMQLAPISTTFAINNLWLLNPSCRPWLLDCSLQNPNSVFAMPPYGELIKAARGVLQIVDSCWPQFLQAKAQSSAQMVNLSKAARGVLQAGDKGER